MVNQYEFKNLDNVVNYFFTTPELEELNMKFKEPIALTEEQYRELIGHPDGSNGTENNGIYEDLYTYDEEFVDEFGNVFRIFARLLIRYVKSDNGIEIYDISMWRDVGGIIEKEE